MEEDELEKMLSRYAVTRRLQIYGLVIAGTLGTYMCGIPSCNTISCFPKRTETPAIVKTGGSNGAATSASGVPPAPAQTQALLTYERKLQALARYTEGKLPSEEEKNEFNLGELVEKHKVNGVSRKQAFWSYLRQGDIVLNSLYLLGDGQMKQDVLTAMAQAGAAQLNPPLKIEHVRGIFGYFATHRPDLNKPLDIKYWIAGQKGANIFRAYLLKTVYGANFDVTQRPAFNAPENLDRAMDITNKAFQREYEHRLRRNFYHNLENLRIGGHDAEYRYVAELR